MVDDSAIAVLTRESKGELLANGGVSGLTLQPRNARRQRYVVCVRNDRNTNPASGEPHRTAFLVATIAGLEVSGELQGVKRWRLRFGAVAEVSIPDVWKGWRNPVVYKSLGELGIDPAALHFSLREGEVEREEGLLPDGSDVQPLTIAQAKAGLARSLGLTPAQIEITIRA